MKARTLSGAHVVFVAGTLGQGGAERQLFYILRALRAMDVEATVLALTAGEFWQSKIEALGVDVRMVGHSSVKAIRLAAITGALRDVRPDVVQSQHLFVNLYVSSAARLLRLPDIGALRNDGISDVRALGRLGPIALRVPRILAANSRQALAQARDRGVSPRRLFLLPNVVDTEAFVPGPPRIADDFMMLGVGRLVRQKRFDRFLRVVAAVTATATRPVRARIVGAGSDRDALERYASRLGLSNVEFCGPVADMRAHYEDADLLLLTSDHEGTPNVVLEAMSAGLPVVTTRVGGVADLIGSEDLGITVDREDEARLKASVMTMLDDEPRRRAVRAHARAHVLSERGTASLPGRLLDLYGRALARAET